MVWWFTNYGWQWFTKFCLLTVLKNVLGQPPGILKSEEIFVFGCKKISFNPWYSTCICTRDTHLVSATLFIMTSWSKSAGLSVSTVTWYGYTKWYTIDIDTKWYRRSIWHYIVSKTTGLKICFAKLSDKHSIALSRTYTLSRNVRSSNTDFGSTLIPVVRNGQVSGYSLIKQCGNIHYY